MGLVYGRRDKLVTVAFFLALPYGEIKTIHSVIQSSYSGYLLSEKFQVSLEWIAIRERAFLRRIELASVKDVRANKTIKPKSTIYREIYVASLPIIRGGWRSVSEFVLCSVWIT